MNTQITVEYNGKFYRAVFAANERPISPRGYTPMLVEVLDERLYPLKQLAKNDCNYVPVVQLALGVFHRRCG